MQNFNLKVGRFLKKHKVRRGYAVLAIVMSFVVAFSVFASLIEPAMSASKIMDSSQTIDDAKMLVGSGNELYSDGDTVAQVIEKANAQYALGIASQFSVFLEGDFVTREADTEGRMAVGGNLDVRKYVDEGGNGSVDGDGYRIGYGHYTDDGGSVGSVMDEMYGTNGDYAHAIVGGWVSQYLSTSSPSWRRFLIESNDSDHLGYYDDTAKWAFWESTSDVLSFADAFELLRERTEIIDGNATAVANSGSTSVTISGNTVTFDGKSSGKTANSIMFNITEEQMAQISAMSGDVYFEFINIPDLVTPLTGTEYDGSGNSSTVTWESSYIMVNIEGSTVEFPASSFHTSVNGVDIGKGDSGHANNAFGCGTILYNMADATSVTLGIDFQGTILAPDAAVGDHGSINGGASGHLSGALIAKSFDGSMEFGYRPYTGPIEVLNVETSYEIAVDKLDNTGAFLSNAVLGLYTVDDSGNISSSPIKTWKSGGSTDLISVTPGIKYAIKEISAPNGYDKTETVYYFTVTEGEEQSITLTSASSVSSVSNEDDGISTIAETTTETTLWTGETDFSDWSSSIQIDSSTMSQIQSGDIIRVYVSSYSDSTSKVTIQNSSWQDLSWETQYPVVDGAEYADFKVTDDLLSTVQSGVIVKGCYAIATKVSYLRTTSTESGGDDTDDDTEDDTSGGNLTYVPDVTIKVYSDNNFSTLTTSYTYYPYKTENLSMVEYEINGTRFNGSAVDDSYKTTSDGNTFVMVDGSLLNPIINLNQSLSDLNSSIDGTQNNFIFVNEKQPSAKYKVAVEKQDENGSLLSGAQFGLYTVDASGNLSAEPLYTWTSGNAAETIQGIIEADVQYAIKEITPPDGYTIVDDGIEYFTITKSDALTQSFTSYSKDLKSIGFSASDSGYNVNITYDITITYGDGSTLVINSATPSYKDDWWYFLSESLKADYDDGFKNVSKIEVNVTTSGVSGVPVRIYTNDNDYTTSYLSTGNNVILEATSSDCDYNNSYSFTYIPSININGETKSLTYSSSSTYWYDGGEVSASDLDSKSELTKYELNGNVYYVLDGEALMPLYTDTLKTFTIVNKEEEAKTGANFDLKKVDSKTGDLLTGAEFSLYTEDGTLVAVYNLTSGTLSIASPTTTSDSSYFFTDDNNVTKLKTGNYYLVETTAPKDYKFPNDDSSTKLYFTIDADGNVSVSSTGVSTTYLSYADSTLTIKNDPAKGNIEIDKNWTDSSGNSLTNVPTDSITVEIYKKVTTSTASYSIASFALRSVDAGVSAQSDDGVNMDFDTAFEMVKAQSTSIASSATEVSSDNLSNGVLTINLANYSSKSILIPYSLFSQASQVNFTGVNMQKLLTDGYTISVTGVNDTDITMTCTSYMSGTKFTLDNNTISVDSLTDRYYRRDKQFDLSGLNLMFNFPDAKGTIDISYLVGHLVAPNANVNISGGNHEGNIIAASLTNTQAEAHFYSYYDATKIDTFGSSDTDSWYSIENILSNYQYFVSGDIDASGRHIVGGIAAGGDAEIGSGLEGQISPTIVGGTFTYGNINPTAWSTEYSGTVDISTDVYSDGSGSSGGGDSGDDDGDDSGETGGGDSGESGDGGESGGGDDSGDDDTTQTEGTTIWTGSLELGDWSGYQQIDSSELTDVKVGDTIRVYVSDVQSDTQVTIQDTTNWSDISDVQNVDSENGYVDFVVTEDNIETIKSGFYIKGQNGTVTSVTLISASSDSGDDSGNSGGDSGDSGGDSGDDGGDDSGGGTDTPSGYTYELVTSITISSEEDWKKLTEGLEPGTYYIKEVEIEGYTPTYSTEPNEDGYVEITVNAGETTTLTITNKQDLTSVVLPQTGGIGTTIYYVAGGVIIISSCIGLVAKRRKRR